MNNTTATATTTTMTMSIEREHELEHTLQKHEYISHSTLANARLGFLSVVDVVRASFFSTALHR